MRAEFMFVGFWFLGLSGQFLYVLPVEKRGTLYTSESKYVTSRR